VKITRRGRIVRALLIGAGLALAHMAIGEYMVDGRRVVQGLDV
jgi:hypothetical protein